MAINYHKMGLRNKRAGRAFEAEVGKYIEFQLKSPQNPYFSVKPTPRSGGYQLDWEGDLLVRGEHSILSQCFLECKFSKNSPSFPGWYKEAEDKKNSKRWIVIIYKKLNWRVGDSIVAIKKKDVKEMQKEFNIPFAIDPWKDFYRMKLYEFCISLKGIDRVSCL